MKLAILLIITILGCLSCATQMNNAASAKQGITGRVLWKEGSYMPSPEGPPEGQGTPVQRELVIYKLTNLSQVTGRPPVFQQVNSELVAKVKTTKAGYFEVKLPPGTYSVFSIEKEGLFANGLDGQGNIYPIEVKQGVQTHITIVINYKASY